MPADAGTRDVSGTSFLLYGARLGGDVYAAPGWAPAVALLKNASQD